MSCPKERDALIKIISLYKEMPYLWEKQHQDYLNKDMRRDGFEVLLQIYKNFDEDATIKTLKKKIENMRTTYSRELRKVVTSVHAGAGGAELYRPTLWYYDKFSFLTSETEFCQLLQDPLEDEISHSSDKDFSLESTPKPRVPQKRKREDVQVEIPARISQSTDRDRNEKECDLFCKSIGYQMLDLEKRQLTICQKIISDVIFYAKLNRLSEESHVVVCNEFEQSNIKYVHDESHSPTSY